MSRINVLQSSQFFYLENAEDKTLQGGYKSPSRLNKRSLWFNGRFAIGGLRRSIWFEDNSDEIVGTAKAALMVSRPIQVINNTDLSGVNAVGNPIVYKLQRIDYLFYQINNAGGYVQIQFNAINLTSNLLVDQTIWLKSDNGLYNLSALITATSFTDGNTLITTDAVYTGLAMGGYIVNTAIKSLYRVEVELYRTSDNTKLTKALFSYSAGANGLIIADVSKRIRAFLSPENFTNYAANTWNNASLDCIDPLASLQFYIKYTEVWAGSTETKQDDSAYDPIGVFAAMQVKSPHGGNMAQYVSGIGKKWLTKLDTPVMWRNWPFSISFILNNLAYDTFNFLFVSGNAGAQTKQLTGKPSNQVIDVPLTDIPLESGSSFTIELLKEGQAAGQGISEVETIEVREAGDNPVMLFTRNSLGGKLFWLFQYTQEYTYTYSNGRRAKRLILTATDLNLNQWEALHDFITDGEVYQNAITELTPDINKTSTRIGQQVYAIEQDGTVTGVIVKSDAKNKTFTRRVQHIFQIEIEFPEEFRA